MNKSIGKLPPKISVVKLKVNDREILVKVVRKSLICRIFTKGPMLVFGNTIYVRDKVIIRMVLYMAIKKLEKQEKLGKFKFLIGQARFSTN